ncbi:tetratricopeptide repeat protein [Caulobacter sp. KR2-114]|uniref:tetratricopeptide repeat protein n=1 Tax=Caulobacter sp. KR2-114 TaxID=3400912 RepID=UPI003BFE6D6A
MSRKLLMAACATAALALLQAAPAGAMGGGGGGGGGMPSASAPEYDPVQEYQTGTAALQAGKYRDAANAFEHVTDAQPRDANAWYMLGLARAGANDVKGAGKAYQRAVKLDPAPVAPHKELALTYARLKDSAKAGAELDALKARATTCNNACPEAADLKAAIDAVQAALAGGAPAAMATPSGGLIFATTDQGDAAYVRAVSLINEHRFADALASLDEAQKAFGPHPDILTYKGYVSRKLGRLDQAEAYYQEALAIAPGHRGATEYYGELKVVRGDMAGARRMLATLDQACSFGCAEAEDLRRWIDHGGDPAS